LKEHTMKTRLLTASLLLALSATATAPVWAQGSTSATPAVPAASAVRQDTRDIRADKRDLHADRHERRTDVRERREERRERRREAHEHGHPAASAAK